jgi:hypothetical protein
VLKTLKSSLRSSDSDLGRTVHWTSNSKNRSVEFKSFSLFFVGSSSYKETRSF